MNGLLYDIKRTLFGKFTIILIVLLVLIMGLTAYGVGVSSDKAQPANTAIVMPYLNQTGDCIHVSDYVINGYGNPVSGLHIKSSLMNATHSPITNNAGTTNSAGYLNFTVKNSSKIFTYSYYQYYRSGLELPGYSNTMVYSNGTLSLITSYGYSFAYPFYLIQFSDNKYPLYLVNLKDTSNPALVSTMVYNPNYTSSDHPQIYYNISSNQNTNPFNFNKANTTHYGTAVSNKFIIKPSLTTSDYGKYVNIYAVNKTYSMLTPAFQYQYTYLKPGVVLQKELASFFGILLIPIMGIFSAYFYYSKDKTSGVLESIISKPITKGKIMISRFAGNSTSFLIGLLISFGLADIILYHYTGVFISSKTFTVILLGYLVEAIGFAGIVYLVSQFEKTQGQVLGTGIGLLFVLGFMWPVITGGILFLLHIKSTGIAYVKDFLILDSISPSYFPVLLANYILGTYSTVKASTVGINIYSVTAVGLVWVLVPSILSLYFARKRD